MSRNTTAEVVIDGRTFRVAPLKLRLLRELAEEEQSSPGDQTAQLRRLVKIVQAGIARGQPENAPSVEELEDMLDGPDVLEASLVVMRLSQGAPPGRPPAGGAQSP